MVANTQSPSAELVDSAAQPTVAVAEIQVPYLNEDSILAIPGNIAASHRTTLTRAERNELSTYAIKGSHASTEVKIQEFTSAHRPGGHRTKPARNPVGSRQGSSQLRPSAYSKNHINLWKPRVYHHWKSPLLMVVFCVIGLALSIAHCAVYRSLDGRVVGSSYDQEQNLR